MQFFLLVALGQLMLGLAHFSEKLFSKKSGGYVATGTPFLMWAKRKGGKIRYKGGILISPLGDETQVLLKRRQRVKTAVSICRQV